MLGYSDSIRDRGWKIERLVPGTALPDPAPLFTKLDAEAT
jgi:hypothetical protein